MDATKFNKIRIAQETIEKMLHDASSLVQVGGIYSHYKQSDKYLVLTLSLSAENLEKTVVYQALYGVNAIWVRPLSSWLEKVEVDGKMVERFTFVENVEDEEFDAEEECEENCDGEDCK